MKKVNLKLSALAVAMLASGGVYAEDCSTAGNPAIGVGCLQDLNNVKVFAGTDGFDPDGTGLKVIAGNQNAGSTPGAQQITTLTSTKIQTTLAGAYDASSEEANTYFSVNGYAGTVQAQFRNGAGLDTQFAVDRGNALLKGGDTSLIMNNGGATLKSKDFIANGGNAGTTGAAWEVNDGGLNLYAPNSKKTSFLADGVHFNDQVLDGVHDGLVQAGSTQAVNGSQLFAVQDNLQTQINNISGGDKVLGTNVNNDSTSWAIGTSATVSGPNNTAVGDQAKAVLHNSTAVGQLAYADDHGTAVGFKSEAKGLASAALGDQAKATGNTSVAVGFIAEASGNESVALGYASKATHDKSVALGSGSVTDRVNSISVGSAGNERQITNVAAGTADTDAVNVSQLKAVETKADNAQTTANQALSAAGTAQARADAAHTRIDGLDTRLTAVEGDVNTLKTDMTTVKGDITTIKGDITNLNTKIDQGAQAAKDYTDQKATATLNSANAYTDQKATAALNSANVYTDGKVATEKAERQADVARLDGRVDTVNNRVTTEVTRLDGRVDTVNNRVTTEVARLDTRVDTEKSERVAADNALNARVDTEKADRIAADNLATADRAKIRTEMADGDARTLAQSKSYTDRQIDRLENRYQAAVASSVAIASLPQPTQAGGSMVSAGLGQWENETGYAIGVSGVSENNKWVYKAAGTGNSRGNWGGGVSVGFQWK